MLGQDHGAVYAAQEQRIGLGQLQGDHIAFHAHAGQMLSFAVLQRVVAFHILEAAGTAGIGIGDVVFNGESYILSSQGFAVMPLHTIANRQCEFGVIFIAAPFCGQGGHMLGVGSIPIHQRVKHHIGIQALLVTGRRFEQRINTDRLTPLQLERRFTFASLRQAGNSAQHQREHKQHC